MRTPLNGWLIIALLLGTMAYALAEELTLTTYYPSPRGVYQELRVGGGPFPSPTGSLHVLKSVDDGGVAFRVDDQDSDASPFVVDQTGNVGIGTTSPGAALEVRGQIKMSGGTPGTGKVLTSDASGLATWEPSSGGLASVQVFTSSGTWSKPAGVKNILTEVVGGGGGGSGSFAGNTGGGGGGGGYAKKFMDVSSMSSVSVIVGSGGNGGPPNMYCCDANASAFGSYVSATGGGGGGVGFDCGGGPTGCAYHGGRGGLGSGGDINVAGQAGANASPNYAGNGGSSVLGGGGWGALGNSSYGPGGAGGPYGGGGGGAAPGGTGGKGAAGVVIVWEYR